MSAPFRFISGDDDFLVDRAGQEWFETHSADIEDPMNQEVIDGRAGKIEDAENAIRQAISALQSLSLFGDKKAVWLRHVDFLGDNVVGRSERTQELLNDLLAALQENDPGTVAFILTASPVDRRKKTFKNFQSVSEHRHIAASQDSAEVLSDLVRTELERAPAAVTITPEALDVLQRLIHGDARLIVEETGKLITYLGNDGGEITEELVTRLVPPFGETEFFAAVNAFYSLDLKCALNAIDEHFFTYKDARGLITNLQNTNRLVIQLRTLLDARVLTPGSRGLTKAGLEKAARQFPEVAAGDKSTFNIFSQHPFRLGRLLPAAEKLKLPRLIDFQLSFLEAFEKIMDRPDDQKGVMREVAVRCLS